jgi:hypothetical protein
MEEMLPPLTQEGAGFELPRVRQFTVFLDNRVGRLHALARQLDIQKCRIVAISVQESADAALVRLICSDSECGRDALQKGNFFFGESELLAVEMPRGNGDPLVVLCTALLTAEINIHYAYPFLIHLRGPTLAVYLDDPTLAAQILMRKGFKLIGESDLHL